ncbi:MAG: serine/threonine protein kinase [Myxococcales bacterium]|nr:serine/threonine protein kinase [Myxococcales bacterium]
MNCPVCNGEVLEIDVKCSHCGAPLGATGAHRMLGQVMLGQYELVDVLGQGGMSVVFLGKHKLTNQEVALKILPPELAAHSQVKSRFLEEAKALAALDHPNIVHLYNFGQENGYFVLAMQFVQGRTWERIILENKRMDWRASLKVTIDVLRALEYAHGRGVVHRDMKPSNVLVRAHDAMATVMDFGIAKMTTSTKLTATGQTMGTVRYMSPEQVRGQDVDLRTDIYSLGATLYESLTGDTPFDGQTHFEIMTKHLSEAPKRPSALGVEVPRVVEDAVMRSLSKRPDDRFPDAREFRKILEGVLRIEGDLGLVETQKLHREVLGDLRPAATSTPLPSSVRVATATPGGSLADDLEPGTGAVKKRGSLRWVILGGILLAGGGAAAVVMMNQKPTGYQPMVTNIEGFSPTVGGVFDGVLIESGGKVAPAELASLYQATLASLRERGKAKQLAFPDPLQEIVSVPQMTFCEPTAYLDRKAPSDCARLIVNVVIGPKGQRRLLIIDEPTRLAEAFATGIAEAVCVFDPGDRSTPEGVKRLAEICEFTDTFKPRAPQ